MSFKIRVIIAIVLLCCIVAIIRMVSRKKIDLRYALSWLIFCVTLLVIDGVPRILIVVSELLGIEAPVNMLFFIAFIISIILIFGLTVLVSRLSMKNKKMAQEIALLKNEFYQFREGNKVDNE